MNRRILRGESLLTGGAVLLLLSAAATAHAGFPVIDSGAWVRSGGYPVIYWGDNNRLIFIGHDGIKPETGRNVRFAALQWVIGNRATVIREDVDALCYRPGQIRVVVSDKTSGTRTVYEGPLGNEARVEPKGYDSLNCDSTTDLIAGDHRIRKLRPGDGYLEIPRAGNPTATAITYVAGDGRRVPLPFAQGDLIGGVEYYEFQKAYFFRLGYRRAGQDGVTNVWPTGSRAQAYWLWADGRIERVTFPADIGFPDATRMGLVYRVTSQRGSKDGLYLLTKDEKRVVVLSGYVTEVSVGPDGCNVAFAHAPDRQSNMSRPTNRRTLKVANLCSGSK